MTCLRSLMSQWHQKKIVSGVPNHLLCQNEHGLIYVVLKYSAHFSFRCWGFFGPFFLFVFVFFCWIVQNDGNLQTIMQQKIEGRAVPSTPTTNSVELSLCPVPGVFYLNCQVCGCLVGRWTIRVFVSEGKQCMSVRSLNISFPGKEGDNLKETMTF